MDFLDLSHPDLNHNLAMEEALLLEAEEGLRGELLRIWEAPHFGVVMGSGGKIAEEVNLSVCESLGIPVARRSSGGGTVVLGPGCLCYNLILSMEKRPYLAGIQDSYAWILGQLQNAFADAFELRLDGSSDLQADGRKFSGNAQQRKRRFFLHHGTLLYGMDLGMVEQLLPHPPREPDYRLGRRHGEFVKNMDLTRQQLTSRLQKAFESNRMGGNPDPEKVNTLVFERYSQRIWIERR